MKGPSFYRRRRYSGFFFCGAILFITFFTGVLGGFIYRDVIQPEISKKERLEIMKSIVSEIQKGAERQVKESLKELPHEK